MRNTLAALCLFGLAGAAGAQEVAPAGITVELNGVAQIDSGCQLTFVAASTHPEGVESVVFETVLFDSAGAVDRLTLFDFGQIPAGVPRVRQFLVPELSCGTLDRLLINGVSACTVPGGDDAACAKGLTVKSRTEVEMLG
jgi:hypothetical protein